MMSRVWYNENVRNDYGLVEEEERSILWTLWILSLCFVISYAECLWNGGSGWIEDFFWKYLWADRNL
jgi:hypothetical protein